jgi:CRISPR-associated endonuclease/helicase Cas3
MSEQAASSYYAHTGNRQDGKDWQTLKDHLTSVAQLAQTRAQAFGAADWAHLVGLLHDLGKYSQAFQQRLLCESRWRGAK